MSNPSDPEEIVRELSRAFEDAKAQFESLRDAVGQTGKLAELKLQTLAIGRERDDSLKALGAAIHAEVKKGRLTLPPALQAAYEAVDAAERKREQKAAEISDILGEGLEPPAKNPKSVAPPLKKR